MSWSGSGGWNSGGSGGAPSGGTYVVEDASNTPTNYQVLTAGSNITLVPNAGAHTLTISAGTGAAKYSADFGSSTTWTILGTTHGLGSKDLIVSTRDSAGDVIIPDSVFIDPTTFDVTITWAFAQQGRVTIV